MSRFTTIDLSELPATDFVDVLDTDAIFARKKAAMIAAKPELAEALALESDPLVIYLQRDAYDEVVLRARINDGARANMLAFATGDALDQLAAFYGVARLVLAPADPAARPPVAAVLETDTAMRARVQLALEAQSTAGTIGGYLFFAKSADGRVRDAGVALTAPGTVTVTILAQDGDGTAPEDLLEAVDAALNVEDVRPLCDTVVVASAAILTYAIEATLKFYAGPDRAVVLATAQSALEAYVIARRLIGQDVTRSGLFAALHQPGVQNVTLASPAADIVIGAAEASFCTAITLIDGGVDA